MATQELTARERAALRLSERQGKPANLWIDAWQRLLKNRAAAMGGLIVVLLILTAVFAPALAPYHYAVGDSDEAYTVPNWLMRFLPSGTAGYAKTSDKFLFGSDYLGRDLLSRLIYGTRISLPVGFIGATIALLMGLVYGCIAGYYGGRVDNVMMRIVDIMYAFPTMLLIILIDGLLQIDFRGC